MNKTSALVYELCDGTKTVSEISDLMSRKMKTLVSEDFIWLALEQLEKENLLENSAELNNPLAGASRREVIRKVGLASMVMLPLISSLVAPTAAMAQSAGTIALFGACPSGSGCAAGLNCVSCSGAPCSGLTCGSGTGSKFGPGLSFTGFPLQPDCPTCLNLGVDLRCCSGTGTLSACSPAGPGIPGVTCSITCT